MPECQNCGNKRVFDKTNVVQYTVLYDEESGDVDWESDEYEFLGPTDDDYLTCVECSGNDITN